MSNVDWRYRGACRDEDPELFFPVGRSESAHAMQQTAEAKAVCRRCPVQTECRAWALSARPEYGVFGGLSEDERRAMLRRQGARRRARHTVHRGPRPSPVANVHPPEPAEAAK